MSDSYNEPLTFDKVWAALMENREYQKETDRLIKETDRLIRETGQEIKETDRLMKETREQMKETDRRMKETDKKIGDLGNRFGELAEHLVLPGIMEKFNKIGFEFTIDSQNAKFRDPETRRIMAEIDILLENGEIVIAVEVKSKLQEKDVIKHIARMDFLRKCADARGDKRKYQGAIASAITAKEARNYALDAGFYVLEQSGDTIKLDLPEGFVPREW